MAKTINPTSYPTTTPKVIRGIVGFTDYVVASENELKKMAEQMVGKSITVGEIEIGHIANAEVKDGKINFIGLLYDSSPTTIKEEEE